MTNGRDDHAITGSPEPAGLAKPVLGGHSTIDREKPVAGRFEKLLDEVVQIHGQKGAASVLGVGYQTLRRSLQAGRPSPRLLLALERYVLIHERNRMKTGAADDPVPEQREQGRSTAKLEQQLAELADRVNSLEKLVAPTTVARPGNDEVSPGDAAAPDSMRELAPETFAVDEAAPARSDELLEKWRQARILESAAKARLERAVARERTLRIEMALVWEHDKATALREAWNAINRDREWQWRWRALQEVGRERRRLIRRMKLRRLFTLGFWRS